MRRPVSIYLGVLLMLLRTVTTVVTAVNLATDWKTAELTLNVDDAADVGDLSQLLLAIVLAFFAAAVVIDLVMSVQVFRGSNRARFVAMILATILVLGSGVDFFADGRSFTLENGGLLGLSLDILVLVALSGAEARDFTTGNSNTRRDAKRSRQTMRRLARRALHPVRERNGDLTRDAK